MELSALVEDRLEAATRYPFFQEITIGEAEEAVKAAVETMDFIYKALSIKE
jgi:hypothetical protein